MGATRAEVDLTDGATSDPAVDILTARLLEAFAVYLDELDCDQVPPSLRRSIGLARASAHSAARTGEVDDVRSLLDVLADITCEARLQGARRPPDVDLRLGSSLLEHQRGRAPEVERSPAGGGAAPGGPRRATGEGDQKNIKVQHNREG